MVILSSYIVLNLFDTAQYRTNKTLQSSWHKVGTRFVFGVWLESAVHIWFLYVRFVSAFSVRFYLVGSSVCINQVKDLTKPEQKKKENCFIQRVREDLQAKHNMSPENKGKKPRNLFLSVFINYGVSKQLQFNLLSKGKNINSNWFLSLSFSFSHIILPVVFIFKKTIASY